MAEIDVDRCGQQLLYGEYRISLETSGVPPSILHEFFAVIDGRTTETWESALEIAEAEAKAATEQAEETTDKIEQIEATCNEDCEMSDAEKLRETLRICRA